MDEIVDFLVDDVLDPAGYSDTGIYLTLVDVRTGRLRLHLTAATAELLCERIADALESRYGNGTD